MYFNTKIYSKNKLHKKRIKLKDKRSYHGRQSVTEKPQILKLCDVNHKDKKIK